MNKYCLRAALVASLSSVAGHSVAADIDARYQQGLQSSLQKHMPSLLEVYRDLHQHPELGLEEVRTAGVLAREMRKLGFTVTEKVGKTGVVAIFKNGEGPLVMVRADMDGLPVQELSGLPYASTAKAMYNGNETPLMQACGHDIHMATWVGTAKALLDQKDKWKGTLMFVGQPAEEGRGGAKAMMDDRIFERFGLPDHAFAFHVVPTPWDSVQLVKGAVTSYAGGFNITFNGRGGHGSRPNTTIDPVVMAGKFVADVQSVVSRELDPQKFGVVSIGRLAAGNAGNVIPDAATVSGTFRWYEPEVGRKLAEGIERTAKSIVAQAAAPEAQISVISGDTTVINDPALTEATLLALKKVEGIRALETTPEYWSEDYGEFLRDFTSSVYMRVGGFDPALFKPDLSPIGDNVPSNHSPYFVPVPEPTLRTAVTAMTTAVFNVLAD